MNFYMLERKEASYVEEEEIKLGLRFEIDKESVKHEIY